MSCSFSNSKAWNGVAKHTLRVCLSKKLEMSEISTDFNEKLEKDTNDLVRCAPSPFFHGNFFYPSSKEMESVEKLQK